MLGRPWTRRNRTDLDLSLARLRLADNHDRARKSGILLRLWSDRHTFGTNAISNRDYPVIQTATLLIAAVFVVANMVVDLIYGLLDPRISVS